MDTWRRRDSFLLLGLLLLVDYLLVAILVVVNLNALGRAALVVCTVPLIVYTAAEAIHAFRPTRESLRRADRLAITAVGNAFAISLLITLVGLVTGQLS